MIFVDDELLIGDLAVGLLGDLGYRVRAFTDGADALAAFAADPGGVDLVITDMTMPRMTGDTLALELKWRRPELPVILCTGYSEKLTPEVVAELGVDAFVMKPVSPARLSQIMREVLDRRPG